MSSQGFRILRSTDGGAPVLSGTAGALIGVLDALLNIGGGGSYWAKAFSGTNKAVYRSTVGDRCYFRVDDAAAQLSGLRGYDAMTDVDTGTDAFPTTTQQTNWNIRKSNTADSTARTYLGICTDRFALLLISGGWSGSGQDLICFGQPKPTLTSDVGTSLAFAAPLTAISGTGFVSALSSTNPLSVATSWSAPANNTAAMFPMHKSPSGGAFSASGLACTSVSSATVPFGTYSALNLFPLMAGSAVSAATGRVRSVLPHIFLTDMPSNDAGLAAGDTFTDQNGASYQLCYPNGTNATAAPNPFVAIMTSDNDQ